ncbi:MAG: hypothetical protein K0R15_2705 [Clostridiales bacterium]|jgi:hypothetical protein|nr:hypothetical protein [Clostridiales bacterium]
MRKFKFNALLIVATISIVAVGSAALTNISFERSVSAGQVLVDTDENVAIQISNISNYDGLVKLEADGKVSLNLNEAINGSVTGGFNTDATFSLGSSTTGVIRIKNNSDITVTVSMVNGANNSNAIKLIPTNNSSNDIGVGAANEFYFVIDTNGQDASKLLNAVLQVEGK